MKKINISKIKNKVKIETIIGSYIKIFPISRNLYRGLCPFRKESKPSFTVYIDSQRFICFGCGASGDVIDFLMRYKKISFLEALDTLQKM